MCDKKFPQDYGTLLLGLLLVLSVYRLPSVLRDLRRREGDFVQRARMVLTCQARKGCVRVTSLFPRFHQRSRSRKIEDAAMFYRKRHEGLVEQKKQK